MRFTADFKRLLGWIYWTNIFVQNWNGLYFFSCINDVDKERHIWATKDIQQKLEKPNCEIETGFHFTYSTDQFILVYLLGKWKNWNMAQ